MFLFDKCFYLAVPRHSTAFIVIEIHGSYILGGTSSNVVLRRIGVARLLCITNHVMVRTDIVLTACAVLFYLLYGVQFLGGQLCELHIVEPRFRVAYSL